MPHAFYRVVGISAGLVPPSRSQQGGCRYSRQQPAGRALRKRINRDVNSSLAGASLKEISKHLQILWQSQGPPKNKNKENEGHVLLTIGIVRFFEMTSRIS